jgi:hypothetical protein
MINNWENYVADYIFSVKDPKENKRMKDSTFQTIFFSE